LKLPAAVAAGATPWSPRLVPAASLAPGAYQVRVGASTRDQAGGFLGAEVSLTFRMGPVPAPLAHDLDQDGETTVADFLIRRCRGAVVDFPPLFLAGAPAALTLAEGARVFHAIAVLDPEGGPVDLDAPGAPDFARVERVGSSPLGDTFVLVLEPGFEQAGAHLVTLVATDLQGAAASAGVAPLLR
jgi:hypothetical protein